MNEYSDKRRAGLPITAGAIFLFVVIFIAIGLMKAGFVTVPAGYRGVKTRFGQVVPGALAPGLHFKAPLIDDVTDIEVREQKAESSTSASSKDLQAIQSKIAVNFRPIADKVDKLFDEIGLEYIERVLEPAVEETVKAVTAKYTAEALITERTKVRDEMEELLRARVEPNHISITKFNIIDFAFSKSFNQAIEEKQTAEQEALQATNILKRVSVEADQKIEQARGAAESVKLQAKANAAAILMQAEAETKAQEMLARVINSDVLRLRAIEQWDGVMPRVTGDVVPFIGIDSDPAPTVSSQTPAQ
jgi:regulator of protease activity HflC (stomatin/prohibitin superfamily)